MGTNHVYPTHGAGTHRLRRNGSYRVPTKEKPVVKNVLVVVDHFTRYVQAFITNNHMAFNHCPSAVQ